MINEHEIAVKDRGNGYVVGELSGRINGLDFLRPGALVCLFDGTDVMLNYVMQSMKTPKRDGSSVENHGGGFNAFDSYDQALTTFRSEPEKVVNFNPAELRIKDANEAGSNVDYDVTGDYIDMGRYMEGIPEVMGSMHNGNSRNRRVNLMINLNQVHYIDHADITHRSERILRLVDALEAGGVRTLLTGIESNECGHTEIVLKHHEETLTISDLAVVTHPEFLRRVIFRINEYSKTWQGGYGSALTFSRALTPEMIDSDNVSELDIVIDGNMSNKANIDSMFDQLERLLIWELSKPVIEVTSVKVDNNGIYFNPNGARDESEIRREGQEVIYAA